MSEKSKTTTRATIANAVYKEVGVSNSVATEITNTFFDEISNAIIKQGHAKISNFGSFYRKFKGERIGRNPKTKQEAKIPARNAVSFYASSNFKDGIN